MNKIKAKIENYISNYDISVVDLNADGDHFVSIIMEEPSFFNAISNSNDVHIVFKESDVVLAKNLSGKLSMRNCFQSKVLNIIKGEVLSEVKLAYKSSIITSIITARSLSELDIKIDDTISWLIKATSVSILVKDI